MTTRATVGFRLLVAVWLVVLVWQGLEHHRVRELARAEVVRRARDITWTLERVIRSQGRFNNVNEIQLESALEELVRSSKQSSKVKSIMLLNAAGEKLVSTGEPLQLGLHNAFQNEGSDVEVLWELDKKRVIINTQVDFGTNPPIVVSFPRFSARDIVDLPGFVGKLKHPAPTDKVSFFLYDQLSDACKAMLAGYTGDTNAQSLRFLVQDLNRVISSGPIYDPQRFAGVSLSPWTTNELARQIQPRQSAGRQGENPADAAADPVRQNRQMFLNRLLLQDAYPLEMARPRFPPPSPRENTIAASGASLQTNTSTPTNLEGVASTSDTAQMEAANARTNSDRPMEFGRGRRRGRPNLMTEEERKEKGLHGLALVLPTDSYQAAVTSDLWLRIVIGGFAAISVVGFGLAWRNLVKSSEIQMRLVRASEMNTHLLEMNVAAAGLAHETRNPLNIIRGLAQMISRSPESPEPVRKKSLEITDEVDRVTVQLNEFINYSKPREVRRSPIAIGTIVHDVARTLKSDLDEKAIKLDLVEENLTISADQQLLRQVLFNLLINAIQAVPPHGQIQIVTHRDDASEASFEIRDNGPGVPPDQRKDIFRPYFTTREKGTGLGLAVVKQMVMVHGWEIECLANNGQGAVFRVSRLQLVLPAST